MPIALIAALARNGAIGRGGTIPWRLPEDLQHFKRVTLGGPVVMGRKTWDSLPAAFRPLPGRRNIVVTRNASWSAAGAERAASLDDALARLEHAGRGDDSGGSGSGGAPQTVFVIGGAELYAQALPRADELILTEVDIDVEGADTFFPPWDRERFVEVERESHVSGAGLPYSFAHYRRRP